MTDLLIAAQAAPSVTIQLPTAMTWVLAGIGVLLAIIAWFLRREITNNDRAHTVLSEKIDKVSSDTSAHTVLSKKIDRVSSDTSNAHMVLSEKIDKVGSDTSYIRGVMDARAEQGQPRLRG